MFIPSGGRKNVIGEKGENNKKIISEQYETNNEDIQESFSATSTVNTYLNNFSPWYFSHLNSNTALNVQGSCGYVAISYLLSFYDTYWNDNMIPEEYDQISTDINISPGVRNEIIFSGYTAEQYYNAVSGNNFNNDNVNKYFQFLLFKIAHNIQPSWISFSNNTFNCGVNYNKMISILNGYLFDYLGVNTTECELITIEKVNEGNYSNVKDFAKGYIKQGYPVILGIPGHVTVAYDYDINTDMIYGHWGWRSSDQHKAYTQLSDAYAIVLKTNHIHSNNYILNNVATCSCKLSTHQHVYKHQDYSSNQHKVVCFCGDYFLEKHYYKSTNEYIRRGHRYNYCVDCRHLVDLGDEHIPVDFNSVLKPKVENY